MLKGRQSCCYFCICLHLADSDASNWGACEDGGGGDEEEEDGQDAVAQTQVQQKEAAWLPRLVVGDGDGNVDVDVDVDNDDDGDGDGDDVLHLFGEDKCKDDVEVEEKADESEEGEDQTKNQLQQKNENQKPAATKN